MFAITPDDAAVLVIDVQERFLPSIPDIGPDRPAGRQCRILIQGARLLGLPVTISEQYAKGLGPTLAHLTEAAGDAKHFGKTHFSCLDDPVLAQHIDSQRRSWWVLAGIEAHICVLATAADLLARGRKVIVCGDAVASRTEERRALALAALRDLGALVLPVESVLFRLQRQAGTGAFKAISTLVKDG